MINKSNENYIIKPAYKSMEGQSLAGVLLGGLYLLKDFLGNDAVQLPSPEELVNYATTAKDIAVALKAGNAVNFHELTGTTKTGIILFFMYKIYTKFLDSRTELKKEAMKQKQDNTE
jgi:hypothetical protein